MTEFAAGLTFGIVLGLGLAIVLSRLGDSRRETEDLADTVNAAIERARSREAKRLVAKRMN